MASVSIPTRAVVADTPRSSMTFVNNNNVDEDKTSLKSSPLEREIGRDELHFEKYGGDDVNEPPPKTPLDESPKEVPREPEEDKDLVTWDGPNDPANPQNWSRRYKWMITIICSIMTINVTFASSAPTAAVYPITKAFDVPQEVGYLVTTVFLLGYVVGPLFWGPGSELLGRRPIFLVTMFSYTIFHLGQALAPNIQTLLVTRFLGGFFAAAPLTNSGGVIADIWDAAGRGPVISLFTACVFLGPVLGPIVGGYVVESGIGFRWIFWIMMIFAGSCSVLMAFTLPETYVPVLLTRKANALRKADPEGSKSLYAEHEKQDWSIAGVIHRTIYRPFYMLYKEPILVLVTVYLSIVYGVLYALFEALPIVFMEKRHFTVGQVGLVFIGVGIGTTIGAVMNVYFTSHYPRLIKKWKGFPPPEQRLYGAMVAGPCLVLGSFWLGWTGEYTSVPWWVPALSTIFIGISVNLVFISFLSYLVDTYLMYSASAFAANTMVRSAVAAAFPLFTVQMFNKLGVNWAASLIGFVGVVLAPSPFLFYKYGAKIRERSKFAPCIDLRIAKELEAEERRGQV